MHPALNALKHRLSPTSRAKLRPLWDRMRTLGKSSDLSSLARCYGTDKWGCHFYTTHYQRYFEPWRTRRLKILEIGVGGYDDLDGGGTSLRMWRTYFPHSQVVGIDLYDKSRLSQGRITVLQCDQTDARKLTAISQEYGPFDIIIDDGSHLNEHVIRTFHILFPLLNTPGFYAIEDLQTAYWPSWGGIRGASSMDFLKRLVDSLNYAENPLVTEPTYYDRHICEMAFFHNLAIIRKGCNDETSNCPEHIEQERRNAASLETVISHSGEGRQELRYSG